MSEIRIVNENGEVLETLKVKKTLMKYIIYRGRLLVATQDLENLYDYIERSYLEIN